MIGTCRYKTDLAGTHNLYYLEITSRPYLQDQAKSLEHRAIQHY